MRPAAPHEITRPHRGAIRLLAEKRQYLSDEIMAAAGDEEDAG